MSAPHRETPRRHRLSVDDYYRMAAAGILHGDARVELIEGEIIDMTPIGTSHGGTVNYLNRVLTESLGRQAIIAVQNPVRLGAFSEPQPDLMVLRPRGDFYRNEHPRAGDVLLLIEVADTTLRYDREVKMPLYARHGVVEVWLADLENRRLEIFRDPAPQGYRDIQPAAHLDRVPIQSLPDITLNLSELFPG
jgi:Uma2 family endonuclease